MRGRGLSPHHLLSRPARRDGRVQRAHPRREGEVPGAALEWQPRRARRARQRPPLREMARPVPEAELPVRACRRRPGRARAAHPLALGQGPPAAGLRAPRRPRQDRARDEFADRLRRLGRGALRPRSRPRALHDRRRRRLQHGGDGEQGPQHLQHQVRAGQRGDGDRRRLRGDRIGGRPRVLPQLDGQPHHLPRLVPAEPEGRPDGLSRPGVQHGHGGQRDGARHRAHRQREEPAPGAVPRRRRADGAPGAAEQLRRDQQLLHLDRLRKGRRGRAHDADAGRPRRFRARHDALFPAPRRPRRDVRRLRAGDRRRQPGERSGPPSAAIQALVLAVGHAQGHGARPLRRAVAHVHPRPRAVGRPTAAATSRS